METEGVAFFPLPPYIPSRKRNEKLVKDSNDENFSTFTPILPKNILFVGELHGKIPQWKFIYYDLNDRKKYPQEHGVCS